MTKIKKSCLNCYYFRDDNLYEFPFCEEHGAKMPVPDSDDQTDYGYCSDYLYECYHCVLECCPKNPKNVEIVEIM